MKIICTQENLKKGLGVASRISTGSSTLPILNNILIKTNEGTLKLSSTNLEIGINTVIRCKVEEEGGISVPAKTLTDLINNLPSGGTINLAIDDNSQLLIQTENHKTKIKGLGLDEFPLIPQIEENNVIEIPTKKLKQAISQVVFAAAYNETQPEVSGILFSIQEGTLKLVATDRYRLAEKAVQIQNQGDISKNIIIPSRAVQELNKILSMTDCETTKLFVSQNQVMLKIDNTEIISRLIDGQYPDYKQIIPQSFNTQIKVKVSDLAAAMKTTGIFTHIGNNVTLEYKEPNILKISSSSGELGESNMNIQCEVSGQEGKMIFNHKYILDCLSAIGTERVVLKIINDNSPAVLQSEEQPEYLYLVMPIKV